MTLDQINSRVDVLAAVADKLERIPRDSFDTFMADFRNLEATLHLFQVGIQALMDLGGLVVAHRGLRAPSKSRDVLAVLEEAGALPAGSEARFGPMFSFRNRVVHLYDRVDPKLVYASLLTERSELQALTALLIKALDNPGS